MAVLTTERAEAVIKGFGGEWHWHQLSAAHDRFGRAFGFTIAVVGPEGGPTDGRPHWVAARDAVPRGLRSKAPGDRLPPFAARKPRAAEA